MQESAERQLSLTPAEERGRRVRLIRDWFLKMSREEFCKNSPISPPALKVWELAFGGGLTKSGARKFSQQAKILGVYCTDLWLMEGVGPLPVFSNRMTVATQEDETHIAEELRLFREIPHAIDTQVQDDGLLPILSPGDYVGGVIQDDIFQALNKICIVVDVHDQVGG